MRFKEFVIEAAPTIRLGGPTEQTPIGYKRWGVEGKVVFAPATMTPDQVSAAIEANPALLNPAQTNTPTQTPIANKPKVILGDINKPAPQGYKKHGVAGQVVYALANLTPDQISAEIEKNPNLNKVVQQKVNKAKAELSTPQAQQLKAVAMSQGIKDAELNELLAQAAHETLNFTRFDENMNYDVEGLLSVHKKYFNAKTAKAYANKPQAIANRVYANRMGNGDEKSGDGWKYRGRGYLHLTGKDNYDKAGKSLNVDLLTRPELVNQFGVNGQPGIAELVALWYWKTRVQSKIKSGDMSAATRGINPAGQGSKERILKRLQYQQTGV